MPESYFREDRGHPFIRYLTAPEAAKLLEDAGADKRADVEGGLEDPDGFAFWDGWHESTGPMIRVRVRPVAREHVPRAELERLEREAAGGGVAPGAFSPVRGGNASGPVNAD